MPKQTNEPTFDMAEIQFAVMHADVEPALIIGPAVRDGVHPLIYSNVASTGHRPRFMLPPRTVRTIPAGWRLLEGRWLVMSAQPLLDVSCYIPTMLCMTGDEVQLPIYNGGIMSQYLKDGDLAAMLVRI